MNILQIPYGPKTYIGVKKTIQTSELSNKDLYGEAYQLINDYIQDRGIKVNGQPVTAYFTWDEESQETCMAPSIPVENVTTLDTSELILIQIPECEAVFAEHWGHYMDLVDTHKAVVQYLENEQVGDPSMTIEEYVTDPGKEEDDSKWLTNVYYIV